MAEVKVTISKDGPILVQGEAEYADHEGNPVDTAGKATVALCRCGHSENKPFCDGAHSRTGFKG